MIDIEAIKKREQAATAGRWVACRYPVEDGGIGPQTLVADSPDLGILIADCEHMEPDPEYGHKEAADNAEFIAHARTDIPALVAEVEVLQRALDLADEASGDKWTYLLVEQARKEQGEA